jgi:hypothetical protein
LRGIILSLMLASVALAATEPEAIPGGITRPGYNPLSGIYTNSSIDQNARILKDSYGAGYASYNAQIPAQAVVVGPALGSTGTDLINDQNIETAARNYLFSTGLITANNDLQMISKKFAMGRIWFVKFHKNYNGLPVEDAGLGLAITPRGRVSVLWGNLDTAPIAVGAFGLSSAQALEIAGRDLSGTTTATSFLGKSIFPLYFGSRVEYHPVYSFLIVTNEPYAEWKVFVDAENGQILERTNQVFYDIISGNVSGSIQPLHPNDTWEDRNFHDFDLNFDGFDAITTDSLGNYSVNTPDSNPINLSVYLRGPYLKVMNDAGSESQIYTTVDPPSVENIYWDDTNSEPQERDAWYSGVTVHNWIVRLDPGLGVMDFPMVCNVNVAGSCNAFWASNNRTINFYEAGGGCPNIAQIADVIYHEYGHGITDLQTRPDGPSGAMHEGFSDYLACSMTNQSRVGVGFFLNNPSDFLRNLDNLLRYPDNITGESHNDGQIIGGALWHTRQALSPYPMGYTDSLWHFARYALTNDFEPYFWAFLDLDDNDGNINNGTPHAWDIFHNFGDRHGIGPGTKLTIVADTLFNSEDTTRTFPLNASITSIFTLQADSVIIYYNSGGGYLPVHMSQDGAVWTGQIPRQHSGTYVNYYILAVDSAGFRGTFPANAPDNHYTIFVGPDLIPPAMALVQGPPNTINLFGPYGPFIISASDINGIDPLAVKMYYRINSEREWLAYLSAGPDSNQFTFTSLDLSRNLFTGDTVHYYFSATDGAHIPNMGRLPASGTFNLAMATSEVIEDFETSGMDRWQADDGWVLRNDGYNSHNSIWFSNPQYPNNANASITMNFDNDLSAYRHARVTFYRRNIIAHGDTCFVEVSNNGGISWTRAGAICDTLMPAFRLTQFDVSPILRSDQHHYKIRFRFVSDPSIALPGIFIDDVGWSVDPAVDGIAEGSQLPEVMDLAQNYPNPFNPETRIDFALPSRSDVRLEIFDLLGRRITTLVDDQYQPGKYSVVWNGQDRSGVSVASGIYFYRLTTERGIKQEKMTLLR